MTFAHPRNLRREYQPEFPKSSRKFAEKLPQIDGEDVDFGFTSRWH
jgi:hypothetical protein